MSELFIGTSGWSYKDWENSFYPDGLPQNDYLAYYSSQFDTVEVNATYYNVPSVSTVERWKGKTERDFQFSVKGHRRITHYNKMKDVDEHLNTFLSRVRRLGDSLKTVNWQFPPSFKKDTERLKQFLDKLPDDQQFAFEFRHISWLDEEVYELLSYKNAAIVWQSAGEFPDDCTPTADFIYIRFHGLTGYRYSYQKPDLEPWADIVQRQLDESRDAQVYFNNPGGNAIESAQMMRKLLS
ncbi:DUF72 domain-containing protein [Fodinibius sp. Rm-B-1B1-1]|uniref:DUF72 domain-containing protein n=1 Tax=Fodinibius alkaliphilus TaxID=3140241 RepID=UPI00315A0340